MNRACGKNFGRGFTLVEALLAAVVLAMAVTAITLPFAVGARNDSLDASQSMAVALAQEMMEEILSKPFKDPQGDSNTGPDPGQTSRSQYDNMDDYDGYVEAAGNIKSIDGSIITDPAATGLSRQVSVAYVYVSGQDMSKPPTFMRIIVTVKYKGQTLVTLTRLAYALN